jgi:hypothetical protein
MELSIQLQVPSSSPEIRTDVRPVFLLSAKKLESMRDEDT